ncbi:MAG: hypothetical protein WC761_00455 [Candidatus Paceibacterota bacterium]|jgi:hypothetical protein
MTTDFRASQIQTNKIITSGSTGTGAKLVFYDISAQNTASLNQGVINPSLFNTSSIGTDVFLYVSGSRTFGTTGVSVFGGALYVSGAFNQGGQSSIASGTGAHAEGDNATASGVASHAEGLETLASGDQAHAEGNLTVASGNYSHAEGSSTTAAGLNSHAEGTGARAPAEGSHAEGANTVASGTLSHAEGLETTSWGFYSHAEGYVTVTSGAYSHAEGEDSYTYGSGSHAEGRSSKAYGDHSHAEGYATAASGTYSHAGGKGTVASGSGQTVFGSYNKEGNEDSLFIIGNGQAGEITNTLRDIFLVNENAVMIGSGALGDDVFLFVSGTISSKNSTTRGVGLFTGDVHISGNLTVGGSAPGGSTGSLFRLELADYVTVSSITSTAIGQVIFPANEFTGSITLRGVISTTDASTSGSVRLYNVTSGSYVHIGGPGLTHIPVAGTTPTIIQSVDLFGAANFYTGSQAIYELQASCSNASFIASFGGFEVRPSGSFTGVTTFVTGAAGGGDGYWTSPTAGFIFTTGSANISGSLIAGVSGTMVPTVNTTMYGSVILATAGTTASISSSTALNEPRGWASAIMASEDISIADSACSTIIGSYRSQIRVIDTTNFFRVNQAAIVAGVYDDISDAATSAIVGSSYSSISGTLASGRNMTILGGAYHHVSRSAYSSVAGGYQNVIRKGEQSGIIAGYLNELRGREAAVQYNSVIVGGESNYIGTVVDGAGGQVGQSSWGVIAGGYNNIIKNNFSSFIGGGENNYMEGPGNALDGANGIIAGTGNQILSASDSGIFAGNGSYIQSSDRSIVVGSANTVSGTNQTRNIVLGSNWILANVSNTTAIGDPSLAHKLLVSASSGIFIGGNTQITGNLSVNGTTMGIVQFSTTTTDATPATVWTFALSASALYDMDISIVAVGTGSGMTKRFKRNAAVSNYSLTSSLLQDSVFVPILDVSGSTGASTWDVGLRTTGSNFYVDVTGSASQTVRWVMKADYNFGGSA